MAIDNPALDAVEISVAIIAMNCSEDVKRLLGSLKMPLVDIPHEIVFVDNASTDGTVEMLRSDYKDVILIVNDENNGVAPARNQALKKCKGRFIYIVDADCEYQEGSFKDAIKYLDKNPDVGLIGFRLYYPNGDLQDTGRTLPTPKDLIINRMDSFDLVKNTTVFRRHRMRDFDPLKLREAGFVAGASQFFRRDLLNSIGYLDETMFYGYEDSDFCARVHKNGQKVVYFPNIVVVHHHQRLTKKNPLSKMTLVQLKSYRIFYRKHYKSLKKINRNLQRNNNPPVFEVM